MLSRNRKEADIVQTIMPREEGVALALLSVFGSLHADCLNYALFRICGKDNNQWYLNRMVRQMKIFSDGVNYMATPRSKCDEKILRCFWVLMQYIDSVELPTLQREMNPDGVSFIRGNKLYQILIAASTADITLSLINRKDSPDTNYIIIIRQEKEMEEYEGLDRKHAFAIVEPHKAGEIPEVAFFIEKALEVQ